MKRTNKRLAYADDAPLTKAEMRRFRPAKEVDPELVAAYQAGTLRVRGPGRPKSSTKTPVSIRLDDDVIAFFKSKGAGWQTRISEALRAIVNVAK